MKMASETEKKPTLTINDPVDPPTLKRIGEIQNRRLQLGDMLLDFEQEKVKIIVESRKLDDERSRLFTGLLNARGIAPHIPVEIDPETGRISLVKVNGVPAPQPEPPHETSTTTPAPPPTV
jgi:hypothetical protein